MKAAYEILGKPPEGFQDSKIFNESKRQWNVQKAEARLKEVLASAQKHKVTIALQYGTLLGYIRDGGLIEHDYDIDLFGLQSEYVQMAKMIEHLESIGFSLVRSHPDGVFNTVLKDGITVDFYCYRDHGDGTFNNYSDWMEKDDIDFDEKEFLGEKVFVYKNPERILTQWYGYDWLIPQSGKSATPCDRRGFRSKGL